MHKNVPTFISGLSNIIDIAAGGKHSLVLNDQGTVFSFGRNDVKKKKKLKINSTISERTTRCRR